MLRKFNVKVDGISYEVEVEEVHEATKSMQTTANKSTMAPTPKGMDDWRTSSTNTKPKMDIGANLKEIFNFNTDADKKTEEARMGSPAETFASTLEAEIARTRHVAMDLQSAEGPKATMQSTDLQTATTNAPSACSPMWSMSAHAPAWTTTMPKHTGTTTMPTGSGGGVLDAAPNNKPVRFATGDDILTSNLQAAPATQWNMPSTETAMETVAESATATAVLTESRSAEDTEKPESLLSTVDLQSADLEPTSFAAQYQRTYAPSANENFETRNNSPEFDVFQNPRMGNNSVLAPVTGTIMSIPVREGNAVHCGDVLCVINAMGSDSEILSPVDANVVGVFVRPGSVVNANDILITLT